MPVDANLFFSPGFLLFYSYVDSLIVGPPQDNTSQLDGGNGIMQLYVCYYGVYLSETIDEAWKPRRTGRRNQRTFPKRLDLFDVEGRMKPHGTRELELNRRRVDDLLDLKWSNKPGCQLPGVNLK